MKKLIILMISLVLTVALVSCGGAGEDPVGGSETTGGGAGAANTTELVVNHILVDRSGWDLALEDEYYANATVFLSAKENGKETAILYRIDGDKATKQLSGKTEEVSTADAIANVKAVTAILAFYDQFTADVNSYVQIGGEIEYGVTVEGTGANITVRDAKVGFLESKKVGMITCTMEQSFGGETHVYEIMAVFSDFGTTTIE